MNAILDVHYSGKHATAACVIFEDWTDAVALCTAKKTIETPGEYVPGRFFERELPCLLSILEDVRTRFETIVIDGYVHLEAPPQLGLGVQLARSIPYRASVIGVAKSPFRRVGRFVEVYRGRSRRPLFVSATGMSLAKAARLVGTMHGPHRLPTLIREADRICRGYRARCQ
jgi:deoxyribonuclease V